MDMVQKTQRILLNGQRHFVKHLISGHLVFHLGISLSIGLQADTLTQLIHIIDMIHPFIIHNFQKDHTLQFTHLLLLREFCFFHLVQLHCLFIEILTQFFLVHAGHFFVGQLLQRNDRQQYTV